MADRITNSFSILRETNDNLKVLGELFQRRFPGDVIDWLTADKMKQPEVIRALGTSGNQPVPAEVTEDCIEAGKS